MRINIIAGHGLERAVGARGIEDVKEEILNRQLAKHLEYGLKKQGHATKYFSVDRPENVFEELNEECRLCNNYKADLNIFIHFNSYDGTARGSEIFTWNSKDINGLCKKILSNFEKNLGLLDRGIKQGNNLYVIKNTEGRSILIECCFIDNLHDFNILRKQGIKKFAECIIDAFDNVEHNTNNKCYICGK